MKDHPNSTPAPPQNRPPFFRRRDVLIVGILVLVGLVGLVFMLTRPAGALATIAVSQEDGGTAVQELRLGQDQIIQVEGAPFPVTLEVKDGAIRFINSHCPDHVCEGYGWLSREGDWALCAPAGVMVRVVEDAP